MSQNQETLGQYLKRERESHRVPVQEIALFVKVNRSLIDALEADDFDIFTRRSDCVQLIRQYTAYLKLNQAEVLRLFDAQWKLTGGVKRYPKLTQFADSDS
jgi:cytoskeletal protein RodZ